LPSSVSGCKRLAQTPQFVQKIMPVKGHPCPFCLKGHNSPADWARELFKKHFKMRKVLSFRFEKVVKLWIFFVDDDVTSGSG